MPSRLLKDTLYCCVMWLSRVLWLISEEFSIMLLLEVVHDSFNLLKRFLIVFYDLIERIFNPVGWSFFDKGCCLEMRAAETQTKRQSLKRLITWTVIEWEEMLDPWHICMSLIKNCLANQTFGDISHVLESWGVPGRGLRAKVTKWKSHSCDKLHIEPFVFCFLYVFFEIVTLLDEMFLDRPLTKRETLILEPGVCMSPMQLDLGNKSTLVLVEGFQAFIWMLIK